MPEKRYYRFCLTVANIFIRFFLITLLAGISLVSLAGCKDDNSNKNGIDKIEHETIKKSMSFVTSINSEDLRSVPNIYHLYSGGNCAYLFTKYGGLYAFGKTKFLFINNNGAYIVGPDCNVALSSNDSVNSKFISDKCSSIFGINSFEWISTYMANKIEWTSDEGKKIFLNSMASVDTMVTGKPELICRFSTNEALYIIDFTNGIVKIQPTDSNKSSTEIILSNYIKTDTTSLDAGMSYSVDENTLYITLRMYEDNYKKGDNTVLAIVNANTGKFCSVELPAIAPNSSAVVIDTLPRALVVGFPTQSFEPDTDGLQAFSIEYSAFGENPKLAR